MSNDKETVIRYDSENDILYISFGPPRPTFCVAEIDDVFIMQDIDTREYYGIKILDFKQRFKEGSISDIELPVKVDLKGIAEKVMG